MNVRIVRLYDLLHGTLTPRNARIEFRDDTEDRGADPLKIQKRIPPAWDYLVLAALASVIVALRIHDWQTRLAMVSGDDSLAAVAVYFARPEEFVNDVYIQAWAPVALSSLINWLPALAYKFAGIHPHFFFVAFTILQFVLLALAMFYLATVMTESRAVAWLTAVFAMVWQPHWWNLALVGGLDWMPYADWFALPFLIYALASVVINQRRRGYAALLFGALVHPIMGTIGAVIAAAYIAYESLPSRHVARIAEAGMAVVLIGGFSAIPLLISNQGVGYIPGTSDSLYNPHARPWAVEYPFGFSALLSGAIYLTTLTVLAWSWNKLFLVTLAMAAAMSAVHFAAVLLAIPELATPIASRSTILFVLVALPVAMARAATAFSVSRPLAVLPIVALLFRASPVTFIAGALATRGGVIGGIAGTGIAVVVLAAQVPELAPAVQRTFIDPILGDTAPWTFAMAQRGNFAWLGVGAAIVSAVLVFAGSRAAAAFVLIAALYGSGLSGAERSGAEEVAAPYDDYRDAQLWAREHTPPETEFTLTETIPQFSWRGLSERPVVAPIPVGIAYRTPKIAAEYNQRLDRFYERVGAVGLRRDQLIDLKEQFWKEFSKDFGADYLVRPAAWPALSFPEAYRNGSFVIYRLTGL